MKSEYVSQTRAEAMKVLEANRPMAGRDHPPAQGRHPRGIGSSQYGAKG